VTEKFDRELKKKRFRVTIFGSARVKKNDDVYKQVYKLAKMVAKRGIDVVNGGGPGIMAAASLGHKAGRKGSGSHSIGLGIQLPHEQGFNRGVQVEKVFKRFSKRLDNFMALSNVIVVAPGGIGTTLELFYAWQLMQVNHICNIPIILLGTEWSGLIKWLEKEPLKKKYFDKDDLRLLFLAKNSDEAIKMIDEAYKNYKNGTKEFCLNYTKYKLY
jgi:uncharacterized protein (TIGR00730 family)